MGDYDGCLGPLVAGYVGYKIGEEHPIAGCCCLSLVGLSLWSIVNQKPAQDIERQQNIIGSDRKIVQTINKTNYSLENVIGSEIDRKRPQKLEGTQSLEKNVTSFIQYLQENKQLIGNFNDYEIIPPRKVGNGREYEMAFISSTAWYSFHTSNGGRTWGSMPPIDPSLRKLFMDKIEETQKRGKQNEHPQENSCSQMKKESVNIPKNPQDVEQTMESPEAKDRMSGRIPRIPAPRPPQVIRETRKDYLIKASQVYVEDSQSEVKLRDKNSRLVKEPDGLERKVYSEQNKSEKPAKRGNSEDVVAEDFVDGREDYLRKHLSTIFSGVNDKRILYNGRVVGEALFFTRFSQDIFVRNHGRTYEAKRFYSKQEKRYLKILGFANANGRLNVHLEDRNSYYSSDGGKTWKPNERVEEPDAQKSNVQRSRVQSYLIEKIEYYQQNISPQLNQELGVEKKCKFNPSCSEYAKQVIEKYGVARGTTLAVGRLLRCNPRSKGGDDPVT